MFMHLGRRNIVGRNRKLAGLLALVLACVLGVGAYAFTASNTVPNHYAGAGAGSVTGYEVTGPDNYTFSADGLTMTKVTFHINKPATDVKVALSAANPVLADWSDCEGAPYTTEPAEVKCTFAKPVPDAEGLKLSVAAVSSGTVTIE